MFLCLVALPLAACGSPAEPAASTSASSASASQISTPADSPRATGNDLPTETSAAEPALLPGDVAQVVTTDLVVRTEPGVHEGSEIFPTRLNQPTYLYVIDGPARAYGFDWYLIRSFDDALCMEVCEAGVQTAAGWVAQADKDGQTWIAPSDFSCPLPTLPALQALSGPARLACFGGQDLKLRGDIQCFGGETGGFAQALGFPCTLHVPGSEPGAEFGAPGFDLRVDVSRIGLDVQVGEVLRGVEVSGQFDDPSATRCEGELACRVAFVVSTMVEPG